MGCVESTEEEWTPETVEATSSVSNKRSNIPMHHNPAAHEELNNNNRNDVAGRSMTQMGVKEDCEFYVKKGLDSCCVHTKADGDEQVRKICADCQQPEGAVEEIACFPDNKYLNIPDIYGSVDDLTDNDEDDEQWEREDLELAESTIKWKGQRRHDFEYILPTHKYGRICEETIDLSRGRSKRLIYVMSDLHLGGSWADGMDDELQKYFEIVEEKASEEVSALVLLGDVFEMWLDKFHEVPKVNEERLKHWKKSGKTLVNAVKRLVDEHHVKVFYVRGNHDQEMTSSDAAVLFEGRVKFIECTLILRLRLSSDKEVRVRLAHGHEWDIFNSYMLCQENNLLHDRPIGHYIARAVATSGRGDSDSDLEHILISMAGGLLSAIPADLESHLVDVLTEKNYQTQLTQRLFKGAFKVDDLEKLMDIKCRVGKDKYIPLRTMLQYPYLKLTAAIVGKQDVFHMIKAATGEYKKFIKRCEEDVVVLAHTHHWDLKTYRNKLGNTVTYANTGCWTNKSEEFSCVILDPPTSEGDGQILVDHGKPN